MRCCSQPWRVPSRSIGLSAGRRRLSCSDGEAALVRQQVTWVIGKPHVQTDASDPARQRLMSWLPGDLPCLPVHRVNTLDTVAVNFPQGKLSQAKPLHLRWFAFDRRSHIPVRHEIRDVPRRRLHLLQSTERPGEPGRNDRSSSSRSSEAQEDQRGSRVCDVRFSHSL